MAEKMNEEIKSNLVLTIYEYISMAIRAAVNQAYSRQNIGYEHIIEKHTMELFKEIEKIL